MSGQTGLGAKCFATVLAGIGAFPHVHGDEMFTEGPGTREGLLADNTKGWF